jgi:hypothetical protein
MSRAGTFGDLDAALVPACPRMISAEERSTVFAAIADCTLEELLAGGPRWTHWTGGAAPSRCRGLHIAAADAWSGRAIQEGLY